MSNLVIKKCLKCGALVEVINDCTCDNCGIKCCGEEMRVLVPNSVDAAVEKHVPEYEVKGDEIVARVNHVMEEDHYIEWIGIEYDNRIGKVFFKPGETPEAVFKYVKGATLYAYCNKHALWSKTVE